MSNRYRGVLFTALLVAGAVVLTGAVAGSAASSHDTVVHLISSKAQSPMTLDFPPKGASPGDQYVFSGTLYAPNGRTIIGGVRGTQTDIRIENGTVTVQGMLTYELGEGNELVVGGLSEYPLKGTGLEKGETFRRPVLGGSGKFDGARGEVLSKQLPDGRYDQVFQLTY
jgi:hypothetical protein